MFRYNVMYVISTQLWNSEIECRNFGLEALERGGHLFRGAGFIEATDGDLDDLVEEISNPTNRERRTSALEIDDITDLHCELLC